MHTITSESANFSFKYKRNIYHTNEELPAVAHLLAPNSRSGYYHGSNIYPNTVVHFDGRQVLACLSPRRGIERQRDGNNQWRPINACVFLGTIVVVGWKLSRFCLGRSVGWSEGMIQAQRQVESCGVYRAE